VGRMLKFATVLLRDRPMQLLLPRHWAFQTGCRSSSALQQRSIKCACRCGALWYEANYCWSVRWKCIICCKHWVLMLTNWKH